MNKYKQRNAFFVVSSGHFLGIAENKDVGLIARQVPVVPKYGNY